MADRQQDKGSFPRTKFKDLGDGSFAEVVALEPGSIGGNSPTASVVVTDPISPGQQANVSAGGRLQVELPAGGTGLTNTELRASAVPVSGTFWQATQPVSGPLTDTQLRASAVPVTIPTPVSVTGTFWQATQPVSIAGVVHIDDNAGTISVDDGAGSLTVDGTFFQANQPVTDSALATLIGTATDTPPVYTVLDQLDKSRKTLAQQQISLQRIITLLTPPAAVVKKTQPTLLHRY